MRAICKVATGLLITMAAGALVAGCNSGGGGGSNGPAVYDSAVYDNSKWG